MRNVYFFLHKKFHVTHVVPNLQDAIVFFTIFYLSQYLFLYNIILLYKIYKFINFIILCPSKFN